MIIDDCAGATAEHVRNTDWNISPVGPMGDWPRSLQVALGMMLRSAAPKLLIWGTDLVTFYNDVLMDILSRTGPRGIGTPLPDLWPEVWAHCGEFVEAALSGVPCGKSDLAFEPAGGAETAYYQLCYTPVPNDEGCVTGVLVDVYNATPAHKLEQALREEISWLNKLFSEAPVFIAYSSGPLHRLEMTNRAFDRLFAGRDLQGKPIRNAIPEAYEQGFDIILEEVYRTGQPFFGSDMRLHVSTSGGSQILHYVDFMYQPVRNDDGAVIGILCAGYDVTERHTAQLEAERLKHQILHASRINAMGTMAMTVAHELNQPLAAATNYLAAAQLLLTRHTGDPIPVIKNAEVEVSRAGDVIRRIRSLVRSGRAERTSVSIARAYERAVMLLGTGGALSVDFALELKPGAINVLADEVQLEQIFTNLFANAIDAMSASNHREVRVSTFPSEGGKITITIQDSGPGVPEEILEHAFEQVGTSTSEGLGIGLCLTRTLVEANGGTIRLNNAPNGGAVFTIELDRA